MSAPRSDAHTTLRLSPSDSSQSTNESSSEVMALVQGIPDEDERRLFCQTLFNRLMFLYFLQRKGWLTFNGERDYLEALWKSRRTGENFYAERLRLLFFMALSNQRSVDFDVARDVCVSEIGRVPFLNGGLFEQKPIDTRQGVVVPDEAIDLILNKLFRSFNFTIEESTPYDVEVAVDPEMLGKVFEELVTRRHESGSYYTPRPIVSFMCREALKRYLGDDPSVTSLIDGDDADAITLSQARILLAKLDDLRAVDPGMRFWCIPARSSSRTGARISAP